VIEQPHARAESTIRSRLLALGYDEAVSPTFVSTADADRFSSAKPVALENPLSEETPLLRNSLLPGMLNMLAWNFNRDVTDVRLFEIGNVFEAAGERVSEHRHACVAASGSTGEFGVFQKPHMTDFFALKGDVEHIVELFAAESPAFKAPGSEYWNPGRSAKVLLNGKVVGELGQLHPQIAEQRKLKQEIWLAFFDLDRLYSVPLREQKYERLSRYPFVERDFSLLLDNSITYETLQHAIVALKIAELRSIEPHELFRGAGVPEGKYSLLLRMKFQAEDRTLRDDEVARWSKQVIAAVEALGGSLRA
jgi:phenylalanyl-tRNA synthetase beta chain